MDMIEQEKIANKPARRLCSSVVFSMLFLIGISVSRIFNGNSHEKIDGLNVAILIVGFSLIVQAIYTDRRLKMGQHRDR